MTHWDLENLLFDDLLSPAETVREHQLMTQILADAGAQVLEVTDLLADALTRAPAAALEQLVHRICALAGVPELGPLLARWPADRLGQALVAGVLWRELPEAPVADPWLAGVVEVVRRTRTHPDVRIGSSVRGAIDTTAVANTLSGLRGVPADDPGLGLDAALVALSGRLRLREGCNRRPEDIVTELWQEVFAPPDRGDGEGGDGGGKAPTPAGGTSDPT